MKPRHRRLSIVLACALLGATILHGETLPADTDRTATQILDAYVEAAGGFAALDAISSLRRSGTLSLEGALTGVLEGGIEVVMKPRRGIRTATDLGAFSTTTAWDGTTGWERGPAGLRTLEGAELERLRMQADPLPGAELARQASTPIERLPDRTIDGVAHYAVAVRNNDDIAMTLYLDQETNLLAQTVSPIEIPGVGEMVAVMDLWDYRAYGDILLPDTIGLTIEGIFSTEMTFDHTVLDGPVDDSLFAPPTEIAPPEAGR